MPMMKCASRTHSLPSGRVQSACQQGNGICIFLQTPVHFNATPQTPPHRQSMSARKQAPQQSQTRAALCPPKGAAHYPNRRLLSSLSLFSRRPFAPLLRLLWRPLLRHTDSSPFAAGSRQFGRFSRRLLAGDSGQLGGLLGARCVRLGCLLCVWGVSWWHRAANYCTMKARDSLCLREGKSETRRRLETSEPELQ